MDLPPIETIPGLSLPLMRGESHPCPYLPGREATELYLLTNEVDSALYQQLMDRGFRRSADVFYVPSCRGCQACVPIRVPVATFVPSRSQQRAARRNQDLRVEIGPVQANQEHWDIYARYQEHQHDGDMLDTFENFAAFLCRSPLETLQISFRLDGRLLGASIVDICPDAISSVYFYFDPEAHRRSLGVYSALREIDACRQFGKPYWYIGYYVEGCRKMDYKNRFRPYELWTPDGGWQPGETSA